jgi:hypothetical protein
VELSPRARAALGVNAVVAWLGVVLTVVLSAVGAYRDVAVDPGMYGDTGAGFAGAVSRTVDTLSYFTIWSNIVVAVSVTLLLTRPLPDTGARRVLRLDGLLMITVTMIVYQLVLAPGVDLVGWSRLTDPILHLVTPVLTLLVWLAFGPRGWLTARLVPAALIVPVVWVAWMLLRGAVVDAYPYDFVNVVDLGYAVVLRNVVLVLVLGLVISAILFGVEKLLGGRRTSARAAAR